MSLIERLMGKRLPLWIVIVEAALLFVVINIAIPAGLGLINVGTVGSGVIRSILFVMWMLFYMSAVKAR